MTGMGKDGAAGALAIKRVGGKTLVDEVCPLSDIAAWMRYA
jgi:chemotaxis response regulator CheB